jgi:hypothetical protein
MDVPTSHLATSTGVKQPIQVDAFDYNIHAGNGIVSVIDCFFSFSPVRLLHWWMPQLLGLCYAIWSIIHYEVGIVMPGGHRYIYSVLNWADWKTALPVTIIAVLVVIPVVHTLLFFWHRLGQALVKCRKPGAVREEPVSAEHNLERGTAVSNTHHPQRMTKIGTQQGVELSDHNNNNNNNNHHNHQKTGTGALAW